MGGGATGHQRKPGGAAPGRDGADRDVVLAAFINVASEVAGQTVIVLDDYDLINNPSGHRTLNFLLDHLPPTLHLVLVGRGEPPLPLARYRACDELLEFRSEDLHFSVDERPWTTGLGSLASRAGLQTRLSNRAALAGPGLVHIVGCITAESDRRDRKRPFRTMQSVVPLSHLSIPDRKLRIDWPRPELHGALREQSPALPDFVARPSLPESKLLVQLEVALCVVLTFLFKRCIANFRIVGTERKIAQYVEQPAVFLFGPRS